MPNGSGEGLKEALAAFEPEVAPLEGELFEADDLGPEETGALDAPSPLSAVFTQRRGGRKPGSKNRLTTATAQWLLSQARHPALVLMEAYSMTPAELAERIGLAKDGEGDPPSAYSNETLLQVYKLQMGFAVDVLPYVAKRQPQDVNLAAGDGGDLTLVFGGVSLPARGGAGVGNPGAVEGAPLLQLPVKSDD